MNGQRDILDFGKEELADCLVQRLGVQAFRARQIMNWVYRRRLVSFESMTDIGRELRTRLGEEFSIYRPKTVEVKGSADGSRKYLFELEDGALIETVLVKQPSRYTLCLSSQVGCAMGCSFCRSARLGFVRNLRMREILGQVLAVQDDLDRFSGLVDADGIAYVACNVVFMGVGEPLQNLDNVVGAARILNDDLGSGFSSRRITVSTCGVVPGIRKLGELEVPVNLAVSLNATTDEVRDRLIPANKKWPLSELLSALREFPLRGRRRITMEYVLIGDVNDTAADMGRLPRLLSGIPAKINLIPYNESAGLGFQAPLRKVIMEWHEYLLGRGVATTIRWSRGSDIDAACGQLVASRKQAVPAETGEAKI